MESLLHEAVRYVVDTTKGDLIRVIELETGQGEAAVEDLLGARPWYRIFYDADRLFSVLNAFIELMPNCYDESIDREIPIDESECLEEDLATLEDQITLKKQILEQVEKLAQEKKVQLLFAREHKRVNDQAAKYREALEKVESRDGMFRMDIFTSVFPHIKQLVENLEYLKEKRFSYKERCSAEEWGALDKLDLAVEYEILDRLNSIELSEAESEVSGENAEERFSNEEVGSDSSSDLLIDMEELGVRL